jgi:uncharacterized protein (TIGR00297 family)
VSFGWAISAALLLAAGGGALRWLTATGALAAAVAGTAILAGTGIPGAALLGFFFVSGSSLTHWNQRRDSTATRSGRTAAQVAANGWAAVVGALLVPVQPTVGWAVLAGGLASAQADTWATEIGARSNRRPALITTRQLVAPGTSGGVTVIGTLGGVAGATAMATLAWALGVSSVVVVAAGLGGVVGMLVDSVLGATVQGSFLCADCGARVESRVHCGAEAAHRIGGSSWINNDVVNLLGTGFGAATALCLAWFFGWALA